MGEIIAIVYLLGLVGTAAWATQHADLSASIIVAALWPIFWPWRIIIRVLKQ